MQIIRDQVTVQKPAIGASTTLCRVRNFAYKIYRLSVKVSAILTIYKLELLQVTLLGHIANDRVIKQFCEQ